MSNDKICTMPCAKGFPLLIIKAKKNGRASEQLDELAKKKTWTEF